MLTGDNIAIAKEIAHQLHIGDNISVAAELIKGKIDSLWKSRRKLKRAMALQKFFPSINMKSSKPCKTASILSG